MQSGKEVARKKKRLAFYCRFWKDLIDAVREKGSHSFFHLLNLNSLGLKEMDSRKRKTAEAFIGKTKKPIQFEGVRGIFKKIQTRPAVSSFALINFKFARICVMGCEGVCRLLLQQKPEVC